MHPSPVRRWMCSRDGVAGLLAAVLVTLAVGWAVGETALLYLRIRTAPVRSEPSFGKGETRAVAVLGQSCSVVERSKDGDWVKVRFETREGEKAEPVEGWIHATVLAERPLPAERDEACPWLREGAKGLAEAGAVVKEHAKKRKQDLKPILEAEKMYPSEKDLDAFLKDGQLGLYRPDWPSLEGGVTK